MRASEAINTIRRPIATNETGATTLALEFNFVSLLGHPTLEPL
jgi:hypothetical protein